VILRDVLLLAADGRRSCAYLRAFVDAGLVPARLVSFGPEGDVPAELAELAGRGGVEPERVSATSVNDPALRAALVRLAPRFVIYSGFPGQIVGEALLDACGPVLHAHPGLLPERRGSTTIYWALLAGDECGATVIRLRPGIDTGEVLHRRVFPGPDRDEDVDHGYDARLRTAVLLDVLAHVAVHGDLPPPRPQDAARATTYYVIHPVLKHLALRRAGQGEVAA
jgi:methionyl-tRNA formyltransferase